MLKSVKDLLADVLLDVEFLHKELKSKDCSQILVPESIYKFKESGALFLGDWKSALESDNDQNLNLMNITSQADPPPIISEELLSLLVTILELNGVNLDEIEGIRKMMKDKHIFLEKILRETIIEMPKELKELLEKMLNKDKHPWIKLR